MGKFTFRRGDLDKLDKKIKAVNKKIDKLKNKTTLKEFLPQKTSYKEELAKILNDKEYSRQDFKDTLNIMDSFLKKDSEKMLKSNRGLKIPKFKKREIEIKVKSINKDRAKLQKEYENSTLTDRNEVLEMPEENRKNFNLSKITPKTFKWKNMSKNDYEWYLKTLTEYRQEREYRDEKYRENFYTALRNTLTGEDFERIKEILDKIPTKEIVKKYYTDLNMDIDFVYEKSDYDSRIESIIESWNSVKEEGGY